jgi:hypothetical protein
MLRCGALLGDSSLSVAVKARWAKAKAAGKRRL